ncbi:DUF3226 domain-containing protein [Bengtsoniella intestinalis]|uniref:DUF3226 domain-containing protein n=1 Tax=Bengtsoniella intestinalis TaxID=3073143 RepID=UPI00391F5156
MINIILCEGKTDAILLSYYLCKTAGWTVLKKAPKGIDIKPKNQNQSAFCYQRENDILLICGVGGVTNFQKFIQDHIIQIMKNQRNISKVAIMVDRDDKAENDLLNEIEQLFSPLLDNIASNHWSHHTYMDAFEYEVSVDFLPLIIPQAQVGALETVLLNAIAEDPYDEKIVTQSQKFVNKIAPVADKYLHTRRMRLKAELSVTWAIQSPDKAFVFIDEQLQSIPWENSQTLRECFTKLLEI